MVGTINASAGSIRPFSLEADGEVLACCDHMPPAPLGRALLLHGAGKSNQRRYVPFVTDLVRYGLRVCTFDFSGHGLSSGVLAELSLQRRLRQARAVLRAIDDEFPI